MSDSDLMSPVGAAKHLGVTADRVRQLDDVLQPVRCDGGYGPRVYLRERVEQYARERAAARAQREAK